MERKVALVLPVYNEEYVLKMNTLRLYDFLQTAGMDFCDIIIADNNSTDSSGDLAREISRQRERVFYHFVEKKGKGFNIKNSWLAFDGYDIYSFMDADLSTDLGAFPELIATVRRGYSMAIGSRYIGGAHAERSLNRGAISKGYRTLFDLLFRCGIRDPQCGFKAISKEVRDRVLPGVENEGFFFDTELIIRAIHAGYSVREVPVTWKESPNSTVNLKRDVPHFLMGLAKLKYEQWDGELGGKYAK